MLFLENEIQREIREKFFVKVKTKTRISEAEWQKLYDEEVKKLPCVKLFPPHEKLGTPLKNCFCIRYI